MGSVRRLLAKDRMAAAAKRAAHREVQAMVAALRKFGGFVAALCFAKSLMKVVDSRFQRPPISRPRTTKRERPGPNSSGLSVFLHGEQDAGPHLGIGPGAFGAGPWRRAGTPESSWEPFQKGKPFGLCTPTRPLKNPHNSEAERCVSFLVPPSVICEPSLSTLCR